MQYELLIFDADGTLFDYDKAEHWAFRMMCQDIGLVYSEEFHRLYRTINHGIWREFELGKITGAILKSERFRRLFDASDIDADAVKASKIYLDRLGETGYIMKGTRELLDQLKGEFHLALLTNGIAKTQHGRLQASGIGKYFDPVIISEEVGCQKPNPEIFEVLFSKANHQTKQTALMIGDSLGSDIAGGNAFGIDTCLIDFDNKFSKIPEGAAQPVMRVTSFDELLTKLFR